MKMGRCSGGSMKKAVISISKKNISLIFKVIEYCNVNYINELVILLFGDVYGNNSIVEKDGLIKLVKALPKQSDIDIHIVREGLGYNLSMNDYKDIFHDTGYCIESSYSCKYYNYTLHFYSNNMEDCYWDDQYFSKLQDQSISLSDIKISAVYKPTDDSYLSEWGKSAWKLSENMNSKLLYLDDGDVIIFDELCVYQLNNSEKKKIKDYSC